MIQYDYTANPNCRSHGIPINSRLMLRTVEHLNHGVSSEGGNLKRAILQPKTVFGRKQRCYPMNSCMALSKKPKIGRHKNPTPSILGIRSPVIPTGF